MKFIVRDPDYELSPYTGMAREHWLDACEFLLEGIFSNLSSAQQLPLCKRQDFEFTYPNQNSSPTKAYSEKFEGLSRSFLIAAPYLFNRPEAAIAGIPLADYYRRQILNICTPGHPNFLLRLKDLLEIAAPGECAFQHTCECASLVIGLDQCREQIWDTYTGEEKDKIAAYLLEFAYGRTAAHNWRLFNMLILGFLYKEGYEIDEGLMRDHAQVILSYYAGDGWYRDGHKFDYYTPWAFHVYGPIWNNWYGYEKEPYIAGKIAQYTNEMIQVYPSMFDKDAHVTLWGRSGIYRNAASSPFASAFLLKDTDADPGLCRRINSGALLQFITREDVFVNGVPALGFYGQFLPMVQEYSCAESPFWMGNPFLVLCLPKEHPFWTQRESGGDWEGMGKDEFSETVMDGPGIVSVHQGATGAAEFRTAKGIFEIEESSVRCYARLAFHSHFPWEALDYQGVEAMQYSLKYGGEDRAQVPNLVLYGGVRRGVLYRKEYFRFQSDFQGAASIDLADFPVANGLIRADKMRIPDKPFVLTMGAYGFPVRENARVQRFTETVSGTVTARALVASEGDRQLALVTYTGFEELSECRRKGMNPASEESILLYASLRREQYYEYRPYVMISAVLSKQGAGEWSGEELFPIRRILFEDQSGCGGYGAVLLEMKDGRRVTVDYEGMEGRLRI